MMPAATTSAPASSFGPTVPGRPEYTGSRCRLDGSKVRPWIGQFLLRHVACKKYRQVSSRSCTPGSRTSFTVLEGKNAP